MVLSGYGFRIGDDITAEQILTPAHWAAGDPAVFAAACLEAVDPLIAEQVREGDVLLAGERIGGGTGQAEAVLALLAAGFAVVVCASADAGFVQQAHAMGLAVLVHPQVYRLPAGVVLRLDLAAGSIEARTPSVALRTEPAPAAVVVTVRQAQLMARMRRVVENEGYDG